MRTLANRLKDGLERLGYEFNQNGQFSVEITENAVAVSDKIPLSTITKEKDQLSLLFFLRESRIGGPLTINRLVVEVSRHSKNNITNKSGSQVILHKEYLADRENIPTRRELFEIIEKNLSIKDIHLGSLIQQQTEKLVNDEKQFKRFIR